MTTPTPIRVQCPKCGAVARGNDSHLGRDLKCPRCQELVRFVAVTDQQPRPSPDPATQPQTQRRTPQPRIQPEPISVNATSIPQDSEQRDAQVFPTEQKPTEHSSRSIDQFDNHQKIGAWIAGGGLLILGLSPFFKWIKLGAGGVTGLAGDGKILLAVTVLAAVAYSAAIVKRKWLTPVLLSVQAWGTIAMFWMGALIWKVGSILDSSDVKDNPFAAMFSTMLVSPGAGLYLGLIGGITVAGALGFLAVRLLLTVRNLKLFYASQGISCVLGILLAFFVGPDRSSTSADTTPSSPFEINAGGDDAADEERQREQERQAAVKNAYISEHMELYDVTAKNMDSLLDGKVPGVLFKIRNKGDKSLNRVEVTVYFKDASGNIIAEEDFLPVLVSKYSFSGDNKPLKAGYVWQMESGKFYSAKSVPSEWQEGSINAAITDIEFAD